MIDAPFIFIMFLWAAFLGGCFLVLRDKRQDNPNEYGQDKAGRK